jgi:glycosyltransferase involved in cell wall biosynthesis
MEALVYRRAALLIAMSEYSRDLMVRAHDIAPERVHLLAPPPSPAFLDALAVRMPARVMQAEADVRLLFVGRVDDPRKNFLLLLDTVARLVPRGIDARVTVVGPHTRKWTTGWQNTPAAARVTLLGQVPTDTLADAYRTHDLLVVPSRQEGYGLVVAEALHAGLPIVATRCGGPEGMIRASGAGVVTDHSAEALAAAIERLVRQQAERKAMAERATAYAQRDLSPRAFESRVADLTAQLLATSMRRAA